MKKFLILLLAAFFTMPAFVLAQSVCNNHLIQSCNACSSSGSSVILSAVRTRGEWRIATDHGCKLTTAGDPAEFCDLTAGNPESTHVIFVTDDGCFRDTYLVSTNVQSVTLEGFVQFTGTTAVRQHHEPLECGNNMMM